MNNDRGVRIVDVRKKLGLTQSQFAEKIGLKFSAISMIELGKAPLTESNIRLICLTFGVRDEWLREGTGDMMDDEAILFDQERRLLDLFRRLSAKARILVIEYLEKVVSDEAALRGDVQNAPGGTTQPQEAPQEAKRQESTDEGKGANPIHGKKRG